MTARPGVEDEAGAGELLGVDDGVTDALAGVAVTAAEFAVGVTATNASATDVAGVRAAPPWHRPSHEPPPFPLSPWPAAAPLSPFPLPLPCPLP
jgi:hypothetical protein